MGHLMKDYVSVLVFLPPISLFTGNWPSAWQPALETTNLVNKYSSTTPVAAIIPTNLMGAISPTPLLPQVLSLLLLYKEEQEW